MDTLYHYTMGYGLIRIAASMGLKPSNTSAEMHAASAKDIAHVKSLLGRGAANGRAEIVFAAGKEELPVLWLSSNSAFDASALRVIPSEKGPLFPSVREFSQWCGAYRLVLLDKDVRQNVVPFEVACRKARIRLTDKKRLVSTGLIRGANPSDWHGLVCMDSDTVISLEHFKVQKLVLREEAVIERVKSPEQAGVLTKRDKMLYNKSIEGFKWVDVSLLEEVNWIKGLRSTPIVPDGPVLENAAML